MKISLRKKDGQRTIENLLAVISSVTTIKGSGRLSHEGSILEVELEDIQLTDSQRQALELFKEYSLVHRYINYDFSRYAKLTTKYENFGEACVLLKALYQYIQDETGITHEQVRSRKKLPEMVKNRMIVAFIMRQKYKMSYPDLAQMISIGKGSKHHLTILSGLKKFSMEHLKPDTYKSKDLNVLYNDAAGRYKVK